MKISDAVHSLAALAQDTRLNIFRLLVHYAPEGLPAGQIAAKLRLPAPTLSFHLNVLAAAALVRPHKNGRSIRYSPNLDSLSQLTHFLIEDCCRAQRNRAPAKERENS
jgi:ArsR family transcriptional regulator, arsenate/arsenite/antimonite-responsive transcriptional repressor